MVDLEKAFDSVWIDGLLLKMLYLGINGNVCSLIRNFLKERKFLIRIDGVKSTEFTSTVGLPQGSVLSPILFNIFVYDMCCNLIGKNFKYADCLTLLTYGPDSVLALNAMQDNIKCLTKWLNDWRIQASSTKTKAMTFKKKTIETVNEGSLTFGYHKVEFVESVKVLGILATIRRGDKQSVTNIWTRQKKLFEQSVNEPQYIQSTLSSHSYPSVDLFSFYLGRA